MTITPTARRLNKLLGSSQPDNPATHCHILISFNTSQSPTIELLGKAYDELLQLLCSTHKLRYIYHQSRQRYPEARHLYSQLEQQIQTLPSLTTDKQTRLDALKNLLNQTPTPPSTTPDACVTYAPTRRRWKPISPTLTPRHRILPKNRISGEWDILPSRFPTYPNLSPESNQHRNTDLSQCRCGEMYHLQWFERPDSYYYCHCDRAAHRLYIFNGCAIDTKAEGERVRG